MSDTYLMIGLGKIGLPVVHTLLKQGKTVIGVSRHSTNLPIHLANFYPIQANAAQLNLSQIEPFAQDIEQVCIIVSPDQSTPQAYQDSYLAICENIVKLSSYFPNLQRIVFISSTSVYGQNAGEMIDIATPIQPPTSVTAQILLNAEATLQQHFAEKCVIIRPSGIYGNDRLSLVNMVKNLAYGTATLPENKWTNRIFDTDLIQIIVNILHGNPTSSVYIATDNLATPLYEVLNWLAGKMALTLNLPATSPMGGKRLIHNLPNDWLHYGNFKQGYRAVLENFSTQ